MGRVNIPNWEFQHNEWPNLSSALPIAGDLSFVLTLPPELLD
jgi:hypothetical protein